MLVLIAVCSQSGQNAILKWHSWPLQTNALVTRSAFASPCRACIPNMFWVTEVLYLASKEELLYRAFHHDMLEVVISLSSNMLKLVDEKSG